MDLKLVLVVVLLNVAAVFCMPGNFNMRSLLGTKKRESKEAPQIRALLNKLKALKRQEDEPEGEPEDTQPLGDSPTELPQHEDFDGEQQGLTEVTPEDLAHFILGMLLSDYHLTYTEACMKKAFIEKIISHHPGSQEGKRDKGEEMDQIWNMLQSLNCDALRHLEGNHEGGEEEYYYDK